MLVEPSRGSEHVHNYPKGVNIDDINDDLVGVGRQYVEETYVEHDSYIL